MKHVTVFLNLLYNRKWWIEGLFAAFIFSVIAIVFTWPLAQHFAEAIPQGSLSPAVALTQLFCAEWTGKALDGAKSYWNAPFFYPLRGAFAWGETQPFSCLLIWLIAKLSGYIFAYNLLIMLYLVSFGLVGYAFSRLLTEDRVAALWSGVWLTAGAFLLQNLCVLPILAAAFPSGCIFFNLLFIKKKLYRYFWLAVCFYALTWFTSKQIALFISILLPFALLPFLSCKKCRLLTTLHAILALILVSVTVLSYSLPQLSYTQAMGFQRRLSDVSGVLLIGSLFMPAQGHWLITHILGWKGFYSRDIGVVALAVIILSIFLGIFKYQSLNKYQKKIITGLIAVIIVGLFLGFGPQLKIAINGRSFSPYALFFSAIPGMKYVRVPARISLFVTFAVAIISALAFAFVRSRIKTAIKRLTVTIVLFVLLFAEMWTMPIPLVFPEREIYQHRGVIDWLRRHAGGRPVIELPLTKELSVLNMELEAWAMERMLRHGQPIINGYVSFAPVAYRQLKQAWAEERLGRFHRYLDAYGARYAVVHNHKLSPGWQKSLMLALGDNIVYSDAEHEIYLLPENEQTQDIKQLLPVTATFRRGIIPQKGKTYSLPLSNPRTKAILVTPQLQWRLDLNWMDASGKGRRKKARMLGSVLVDSEHTQIYFRIIRFPQGDRDAEAVLVSAE